MQAKTLMCGTSIACPRRRQTAMGMQQSVDCCMPSHQQTAARMAAKRRTKTWCGMQLVAAAETMSPSRKYSITKSFFFIVDNDIQALGQLIPGKQYNRRKVASDIPVELIVFQVVLYLDVQIVGVQLEGVVLQRAETVPEGGQFLGRLLALADIVAGRDLEDAVDAGVVVLEGLGERDGAVEGVESLGIEHLPDGLLVGRPVRLQMLELGEELEHLLADEGDVLVEELLDGVGAEVEEHGEVLERGRVGGLVDVDYVGEDLSEVVVDVVVEAPLHLAEEVAVEDEFVDVEQQLAADALQQSLEGVLEVVLAAEGLAHDRLDQLFHHVELGLQVAGVELRVGGARDLQDEVLRLAFLAVQLSPLHPNVQQISDPEGFYQLFKQKSSQIIFTRPQLLIIIENAGLGKSGQARARRRSAGVVEVGESGEGGRG